MKKLLSIFMILLFTVCPSLNTYASSTSEKSSDKSVVSSVLSSAKEKIVLGAEKTKKVAVNAANSKAVRNTLRVSKKIGKNLMNPVIFGLSVLISGLGWFTFNGVINRADIKTVFSTTDLAWNNKVTRIIRLIALGKFENVGNDNAATEFTNEIHPQQDASVDVNTPQAETAEVNADAIVEHPAG